MKYFLTPLTIKNITLKNRLVLPPMATSKAKDGQITDELLAYYHEKSKDGNIGLIITEHSYVSIEGKASEHQTSIASDADIDGWKRITDQIHANGSYVFAQISHAGMRAEKAITNFPPLAPSSIRYPVNENGELPKEMSLADIEKVVEDFGQAAKRAKSAGFDGVEIHSAHRYLLNQFYSPITNQRTDQFGQNLNGRLELHRRIIRRIKELVGQEYPLSLRLGACDYVKGGSTIEDAVYASTIFESEGIDLLHISGGVLGYLRPNHTEPGYFQDVSKAIKENIHIPVLLTGGITSGIQAEKILKQQKADLIGVGRAILKDHMWVKRAFEELHNKY